MTFELAGARLALVYRIAEARLALNRRDGRKSFRLPNARMSDLDAHVVGVAGEVAVSSIERKPINCVTASGREFYALSRGPDVGGWQIKSTTRVPPILMVPVHQTHKQHDSRYLLVGVSPPSRRVMTAQIVGWIAGDELFIDDNVHPHAGIDWYVAPYLHPYRLHGGTHHEPRV